MVKLLLVEDDVNLSYIVQTALEDLIGGYQVFTAPNGAEGLKQWEEHHPDVIVTACPLCKKTLGKTSPAIPVRDIAELVAEA